jgi:hypothetical protein
MHWTPNVGCITRIPRPPPVVSTNTVAGSAVPRCTSARRRPVEPPLLPTALLLCATSPFEMSMILDIVAGASALARKIAVPFKAKSPRSVVVLGREQTCRFLNRRHRAGWRTQSGRKRNAHGAHFEPKCKWVRNPCDPLTHSHPTTHYRGCAAAHSINKQGGKGRRTADTRGHILHPIAELWIVLYVRPSSVPLSERSGTMGVTKPRAQPSRVLRGRGTSSNKPDAVQATSPPSAPSRFVSVLAQRALQSSTAG